MTVSGPQKSGANCDNRDFHDRRRPYSLLGSPTLLYVPKYEEDVDGHALRRSQS